MAIPKTRADLNARILEDLGSPVVTINLSDEQVENSIDDALSFWRDYHYDAQKKIYIAHQIVQNDIDTLQIQLDPSISAVTRIFKYPSANGQGENVDTVFNVDYQLRLNDLWDLSNVNLSGYVIARQYISILDDILNADLQCRYRELEGILFLDINPQLLPLGQYLLIEAYQYLSDSTGIWGSRVLRQLATAYARKRWALNLIKFENQSLAGGVTMNATNMLQQANADIEKYEQDFINKYQFPDLFFMA